MTDVKEVVMEDKPSETVVTEEVEDADDTPDLISADTPAAQPAMFDPSAIPAAASIQPDGNEEGEVKHSRAEKKSRKALQKLGLKSVSGVTRVTVKKNKNYLFVISKPEVYKSPQSDTYIIFGEAKIEDLSAVAQNRAVEQFRIPDMNPMVSAAPDTEEAAVEEEEEEEDLDESDLEAKDIELVMSQADVSRAKAVKALKKSNKDVVDAIMGLTMN
ncbi:Nascent polypeptide-associated complex subunit alpha-like protein [Gracilariopsis chorda]|uniref:Nascent polypeptide-associated complex subunit alpha-like protein n=1 Tax=Gracilariopsis chorda TaxID=448386 RepID=A0A2V3IS21_9FLOR|nr:Nascent polypeptide-associated complex subunit alpha-like protein [Gracilariopsis chorda]|eukprot:PXF44925.1 Nascent polypeptide-associated complex subunit alpha-like protein [Gracilariopsis chorda]